MSDLDTITIFSPLEPWKRQTLEDVTIKQLLEPIFIEGKRVYDLPTLKEIRQYTVQQLDTLWDELKRLENPHEFYVDLSEKLWNIQRELLEANS